MTLRIRSLLLLSCLLGAPLARAAGVPAPEAVVQVQLEAYNARNLEAFLAAYADDAELYAFPATLQTKGKAAMRTRYAARFADALLHAVVVKRIVMGGTVIDHERVRVTLAGGPGVMEAIAIYEVQAGRIVKVTFVPGPRIEGGTL